MIETKSIKIEIDDDKKISPNSVYTDNPYNIEIKNFNGPLDLLLNLVKDKNIDIMEVDLVELAENYLRIIKSVQDRDINLASEYLVMAATLLQIKARSLLEEDEEEDEELAQDKKEILLQVAMYKQFKELTPVLQEHELSRRDIFIKKPSNVDEFKKPIDRTALDGNGNPMTLIKALRLMFERVHAVALRRSKVKTLKITASDQIEHIRKLFREKENVTFEDIFYLPSLEHFVITLMALLELVKIQEIVLFQEEEYGPITIAKGEAYAE
ncbi:segregation and condensation protein A [Mycoplasmopsis californica]|uniref:Segregation and condensation protein A n=1 Tax=Mycoplasmopsis equigenitalium TaxID=114883 RepID=A0ABY5J6A2_9BACT|nr:segregation/condensation protein A [Mycoplasmopsis equigenitalium]UUD37208.1 segregation/condensation protein A [Mycoplasmopsis equigenitalium]VEU69488.1 segregation and condensation protein A [Mycoplasmopsis californica]